MVSVVTVSVSVVTVSVAVVSVAVAGFDWADQHGADPQPPPRVRSALGAQPQTVPRHLGTGQRNSAELEGEQTANRVDIEVLVELDVVELAEVFDRQPSRHPVGQFPEVFDRRDLVGVVLVGDLPDNLLEHILDRHQACDRPVLIDQQHHMDPVALHVAQQRVQRFGVRDECSFAHHVGHRGVPSPVGRIVRALHEILEVHDADDVVDVLADHRDSRMPAAYCQRRGLTCCFIAFDPDHFGARHHHLPRRCVAQLEHRLDHSAFVVGHHAPLLSQVDDLSQLDLGGERAIAKTLARRQRIADQYEQSTHRKQQHRDHLQRKGSQQRDGVCVLSAHRARPDTDGHEANHHHDRGRSDQPPGHAESAVQERRQQHRRADLTGDAE